MKKYILIETHAQDCRWKISKDNICQTLSSTLGMGGGNVPIVLEIDDRTNSDRIESKSCNNNE